MTIDKEFLTTLVTIVTATIIIMRKMATKEDLAKLETRLTTDNAVLAGKIDRLIEVKADKDEVNQRLLSVETYLRLPIAPKQEATR